MPTILLPTANRKLTTFKTSEPRNFAERADAPFNRAACAAAHVVPDIKGNHDPWVKTAIDWDQTINFRRHLWGLGLGVWELGFVVIEKNISFWKIALALE